MSLLKKLVVSGVLSLMAVPAVAKQTVTWWDFLSGGDGVRMKAMIAEFNKEHPDIQIDSTTLQWGVPFYTKVKTAVAVGQGPDVMTYHLSRMPLALKENVLSPITGQDLKDAGLTKDGFPPLTIKAASDSKGQLYAVPLDIHSIVLYYNKKYLEGSRFLDSNGKLTGISSVKDFDEAMAYAKKHGSETPLSYATGDDGGVYRVFYTLLRQQGGELIKDGKVLPGDNLDKAAKAISIMADWGKKGYQPTQASYQASVALFTSGKSAFSLNGVWEVPTMKDLQDKGKLDYEWGAVQVPKLMDTQTTWADSHSFAIPKGSDKDPAKRKAVMEVIGWMERHAIKWAGAGHIPAYKPVTESAEFKKMEPNATYAPLVDSASYDPRSPIAGVASPVYDAALNIISPAISGYLDPKQAAKQMQSELQKKLK